MKKVVWQFPEIIEIHEVSYYADKYYTMKSKKIIFDLSKTKYVHSSFIGFLLDIKRNYDNEKKNIQVNFSENVRNIINMLELNEYFIELSAIKI